MLKALILGEATSPDDGALRPEQIWDEIDSLARQHLHVSRNEALRMLEQGKLDGTALEAELKMCLFLLGDDPKRPQSASPTRRSAFA